MNVAVVGFRAARLARLFADAEASSLSFTLCAGGMDELEPVRVGTGAVLASVDTAANTERLLLDAAIRLRTRKFFWGPIHLLVPRPETRTTLMEEWEIHLHPLPPPDARGLLDSIAASEALGKEHRQRIALDGARTLAEEIWLLARTITPFVRSTPHQLRRAIERVLAALAGTRFAELSLALERAKSYPSLLEADRVSLQRQVAAVEEELRGQAEEQRKSVAELHALNNELLRPEPKLARSVPETMTQLRALSAAASEELPEVARVLDPFGEILAALQRGEDPVPLQPALVGHLAELYGWLAGNDPRTRDTFARSPLERIVVVEDDLGWQEAICAQLTKLGVPLPVEAVGDVQSATAMLSSGGPALALVDLGLPPRPGLLPEPDAGLHLIDSLTGLRSKKDGSHYRHRFIVLTAATNYTQAVRRASELGVSPKSYLQKSPDVFESKLPEQVQLALQPGPKQRPRVELVLPTERVARIEGGEIPLERHLWCLLAAFAGGSRETGVLFPPRLQSIAGLALSLADGWAVDPLSKELIQTDGDIEEDDPEDEPDDPSGQHVSNTDPWPRLISGWVSKLRGRLDGAYRQAHHQGPPKNFIEKIGNGYRLNADILLLGEVKPGPEAHRFPVVLVVEDNEQWRSSISSDLERLGMRTKAVACIETAKESVLSEPPDLISLDLELPLTEEELARGATDPANALAFLEFLGENFPDIPVAVLTGIAYRDSVMPRVLGEGVLECNYINKADPDSVAQLTTSLWRLWLGVLARTRILGANSNTPVHALHFDRLTGILTAVGPPSSPKPLRASGEGITILKRLSECPNVPVPRWVLFELVYPNDEATDMEQQGGDPENAFDKHVLRLRRVITQQTGIPGSEIVCGGRIGYYWLQGNAIWT